MVLEVFFGERKTTNGRYRLPRFQVSDSVNLGESHSLVIADALGRGKFFSLEASRNLDRQYNNPPILSQQQSASGV